MKLATSQIQEIETISLRKHFYNTFNVREFLGTQGIIPTPLA